MNDETDPTQPLPAASEGAAMPAPARTEVPPAPAAAPAAAAAPAPAPAAAPAPASAGFLSRHAVAVAITAGVLAVIVVAGGTAWGVSAAVAASEASAPMASTSQNHATGSKASTKTGAKKAHAKKGSEHAHAAHGVRGTLTALDGDTWKVHAASGATVTVTLSGSTAFGTKTAPATRSSFAVGDRVGVLGKRTGDDVTATRVVMVPLKAHSTATPTPGPSA